MAELIDKTLGRYRLEKLLGRGGMAQVYKAWDPNTQRYVAIKVLHEYLANEPGFQERFSREGALVASLNHPNVVGVYDFDVATTDTGRVSYMVMPLIEGPSLRQKIEDANARGERLPLEEVVRIVDGVASALDYAHARGMVHRDIKPANILFDERGTPLLTDFGLARLVSGTRLTESGYTGGTPAYMSPEQGRGEAGDPRSDIYALGIILHEMLTGRLPFEADSGPAMIMKHVGEPLPSVRKAVPELPVAVEAVVYRAAAKRSQDRYSSAGELAAELRVALSGGPISPATRNAQFRPLVLRQTGHALLFGAAALIVLAALALIFVLNRGDTADSSAPTLSVPVAAMTGGSVSFSTSFDDGDEYNLGWPLSQGIFTQEITGGQYHLRSELAGQAHTAIFDPLFHYGSLIVEASATLREPSQPDSGYGLVFRYQDEDNYYVFAVNGRQQVSIWLRQGGAWRELRGSSDTWTFNEAVAPLGQPNYLSIRASEDYIEGFVNRRRAVTVRDDTIADGAVGFYIATTLRPVEDVLTDVVFDSFTVSAAVPSMTG